MSLRTKHAVCAGLVVAWLSWPFAHFVLARDYDINPWKLFGFGMYCTPHEVEIVLVDRTAPVPRVIDRRALPAGVRGAYDAFYQRRQTLGQLQSARTLVDLTFASDPRITKLDVQVAVSQLEGPSASIMKRTRTYHYER